MGQKRWISYAWSDPSNFLSFVFLRFLLRVVSFVFFLLLYLFLVVSSRVLCSTCVSFEYPGTFIFSRPAYRRVLPRSPQFFFDGYFCSKSCVLLFFFSSFGGIRCHCSSFFPISSLFFVWKHEAKPSNMKSENSKFTTNVNMNTSISRADRQYFSFRRDSEFRFISAAILRWWKILPMLGS